MLYKKLRQALRDNDIEHSYLAQLIGRSPTYISIRMNGKGSWELSEAYSILEQINVPSDQIFDYFPPNGITPQEKARKEIAIDPGMRAALAKIGELFILAANSAG